MVAATSNPWPIAPLSKGDLHFAVVNYQFTDSTASEQSELPSLEGALDTSLLDYAGSIADQTILIASLFDGLDDVLSVLGEIGNDDLESIFSPLDRAAGHGDLILSNLNGFIGDNSGSGSGSGSGGAPGACDSLDFGSVPTSVAGAANTVSGTWTVQNNSSADLHVNGPTFNPPVGSVFTTNPQPNGATIPAGGSLAVTILFSPAQPQTYNTTLTLLTDGPDPQPCVNLTGTGTGSNLLGGPPAGGSNPVSTGGGENPPPDEPLT